MPRGNGTEETNRWTKSLALCRWKLIFWRAKGSRDAKGSGTAASPLSRQKHKFCGTTLPSPPNPSDGDNEHLETFTEEETKQASRFLAIFPFRRRPSTRSSPPPPALNLNRNPSRGSRPTAPIHPGGERENRATQAAPSPPPPNLHQHAAHGRRSYRELRGRLVNGPAHTSHFIGPTWASHTRIPDPFRYRILAVHVHGRIAKHGRRWPSFMLHARKWIQSAVCVDLNWRGAQETTCRWKVRSLVMSYLWIIVLLKMFYWA